MTNQNNTSKQNTLTILWWGRFDEHYSRNRIVRQLMTELGCRIIDFKPRFSTIGDIEARVKNLAKPDIIWVPCFRQRDVIAASRWAKSKDIPLIFDPLISAWDKQVFERNKFPESSKSAARLLKKEQKQFQCADILVADTDEHGRFFAETFATRSNKIHTLHVGAEEGLFQPDSIESQKKETISILFYGSFINLQGPETIVEAAKLNNDPRIQWHLLGQGPLLENCKALAHGQTNIHFEEWIKFQTLPTRIKQADILLGVFGSSAKAGRVIPNKVYQSMACARPVITRNSPAYPFSETSGNSTGVFQIPASDPQVLSDTVTMLASEADKLPILGQYARSSYENHFSNEKLEQELRAIINAAMKSSHLR